MSDPKLSKLELQIMENLWTRGEVSIRESQRAFPEAQAVLWNHPDHDQPDGREEDRAPHKEGWQLPPL